MPTPDRADDRPPERREHEPAAVTRLRDELREVRRQLDIRQRQLDRSEARFRDIIERNADAMIVVDSRGGILFANRAAAELFGTPREELIGSDFGFPVLAGETTEVDVLSAGVPRVAEMRVVRAEWDGHVVNLASLRDVTSRKRAETDARRLIQSEAAREASEKSARRFRFLAEASEVLSSTLDVAATLDTLTRLCVEDLAEWTVVYRMNADGRPNRWHVKHRDPSRAAAAAELRDMPIDPNGMHPVLDALQSRRSRVERDVSDDELNGMSTHARERELVRTLGVRSFMLVPMVARDRPLGAITFVRGDQSEPFTDEDLVLAEQVTARAAMAMDNARLYDEANRANQTKADFLAVVSHDLRTPLTAIMGYSDLLLMGVPDPLSDGSRERIERIRASAGHLVYLINELLAFARLDAGREEVHPREVDPRDVLHDVQTVAEPLAQSKSLGLVIDVSDGTGTLRTDPDKLRQILLNLVGNAIKYTEAGTVRVLLRREDREISIEVSDTGPGIAPQHIDQIFEPFWQVESTQRSHDGGTGLGLSVVKRLTALLGGSVGVKSTVGTGTVFTLRLPGG